MSSVLFLVANTIEVANYYIFYPSWQVRSGISHYIDVTTLHVLVELERVRETGSFGGARVIQLSKQLLLTHTPCLLTNPDSRLPSKS